MAASPALAQPPVTEPAPESKLIVRLELLDTLFAGSRSPPAGTRLSPQQSLPAVERPAWSPAVAPALSVSRDLILDGRAAQFSLAVGAARRLPPPERYYGPGRLIPVTVGDGLRDPVRGIRGRTVQARARIRF